MDSPIYSFQLHRKLLPGFLTVGKYDGVNTSLTSVTSNEKVLLYKPKNNIQMHKGKNTISENSDISIMNVNQAVKSICAGNLNHNGDNDILFIGTSSYLHAYDVDNNVDLFYREAKDGANSVTIGKFGRHENPLVLVGGNCCVQGFDHVGNEVFWTVVGDTVCSMALVDFDKDGENELVVGSADYEITAFKNEGIVTEITETEVVTSLVPLDGVTFAYGLSNGTIGLYNQLQRWWRVKSKNQAISILGFDIDGDGVEELITGWSNGKVDARNSRTGDIVFTEHMKDGVVGLVKADFVVNGRFDLVSCSENGEVVGFQACKSNAYLPKWQPGVEEETIQDMMLKKKDLIHEIKNYEGNAKYILSSEGTSGGLSRGLHGEEYGVIPAHTRLQTQMTINIGNSSIEPHVELGLSTNNDTVIRLVLVYGEGIFDGETFVIHPKDSDLSNKIKVPLFPPRDVPVDFHLKALVGYPGSKQFHVFELTRQIPRFSMYKVISSPTKPVNSSVIFTVRERVQRILIWMYQNFIFPSDLQTRGDNICYIFSSLRTKEELLFNMDHDGNIKIDTNDVGLAGDMIQSLAIYLNLEDLQVTAHFPLEIDKLKTLFEQINNCKEVRYHLEMDLAYSSDVIRRTIVQAEDLHLLNDLENLKLQVFNLRKSTEAITQSHKIYCKRHEESQELYKELNLIIQRASRLRVGRSKSKLIQLCYAAIEQNNLHCLTKIIATGMA